VDFTETGVGKISRRPESIRHHCRRAAEDLDYYVAQYQLSGFRGPLKWYRNIDRNAALTPPLESAKS
jgi:hypothetical protein